MDAVRGHHCHEDIDAVFELHAMQEHIFKMHADENLKRMAHNMAGGEQWALVAEFAKLWQLSQFNNKLADLMEADAKHLK
jgi:hypothetical protein